MHNNYFFLKQLSKSLQQKLQGFTLVSCFSQNKDELIFEFNNASESFFIKASLLSEFNCLSFPESFHRARKNSIDLFLNAFMLKVVAIRQFENERSFAIELENDFKIVFKLHGGQSNIILIKDHSVKEIFKNRITTDLELKYDQLDRVIDWSREAFTHNHSTLESHYFTFGKLVWEYLNEKGFLSESADGQWKLIEDTIEKFKNPTYSIQLKNHRLIFSILPSQHASKQFSNPIEAINDFYYTYTSSTAFNSEKAKIKSQLKSQIGGAEKYIQKNEQKLTEITVVNTYQAWGDLIMANMHRITQGMGKVVVEDFYHDNQPIEIKLNKEWNAQKNAEVFYRKSKNQQIEINKLRETIEAKQKEIERLRRQLTAIDDEGELKSLRKKIEAAGKPVKEKQAAPLPYHEFEFKGFKILVGRNAEANDLLTFKHSFKDDLWLHAKDVAGSHVLVKYQSGKNFPKDVIERAAELAAYNSKRKTDSLCPVVFTAKKFVRKRKGDPAGAVVVEKENVIMVVPRL